LPPSLARNAAAFGTEEREKPANFLRMRFQHEDLQRPLGPPNRIDGPNQPLAALLAWETIRAI